MARKARTASGYDKTHVAHVRATCLYVATKLGDLLDHVVIVGGLVPSLLIAQDDADERHAGTADLDIGVELTLFDDQRYEVLTDRLRQAGFGPDTNEKGNLTRQRWQIEYLDEAFATVESTGPVRAAEFVHDARNEDAEADAWGAVRDLLEKLHT